MNPQSEHEPDDAAWVTDATDDDEAALLASAQQAAEAEAIEIDDDEENLDLLPVVAVVGRPNVGKSALVNRFIGRREAVVEDFPGVTRDRVAHVTEWAGRRFILLDTGGWDRDATGRAASVSEQAERAMTQADVILFVVDATVGPTASDEEVVPLLRATDHPVLLVANKADDANIEAEASSLWSLGLGEPHAVSALHGRGSGDLLETVIDLLPEHGRRSTGSGLRRVALVGRPNVGKSSLLNKLAGENRAVVHDEAGTTVDPVDEIVEIDGQEWMFVDTAGIRRRVREASGHEYYASLRSRAAIERCEVAIVVLDSADVLSEQDLRIINMVLEAGRALVIAFNKWDLVDDERRRYLEIEFERDLAHVDWAPRVNISAITGRRVDRLTRALDAALDGWQTRIPTGRLNAFLKELAAAHPHPVRGGKQPRILYGTQPSTRPPTFILFTTGFLEAGYRRFVERRLREEFGFTGTPIAINLRIRTKRRDR
ncbi:MAG: ribosome biogenesis GTPase Der [Actinomycetia bacterium]|nr:ribosome biogenesis GTPase Der [Actinomycetes bacterium]